MADGSIKIETSLDDKELDKEIAKLKAKVAKMEAEVKVKVEMRDDLKSKIAENEKTLAHYKEMLEQAQADVEAFRSSHTENGVWDTKENAELFYEQVEPIRQMKAELDGIQSDTDALKSKSEKLTDEIDKTNAKINEAKELAAEFQQQLSGAPEAVKTIEEAFNALEKKIMQALKRVFLFTVLTQILRYVKDQFMDALNANEQFAASLAQLRGAVGTLANVLASVLGPVLSYILNLLSAVITMIARLFALIFGKSISGAAASAKALQKTAGGYKKVAKAADEASKSLANFDEINQLGTKETETPEFDGGGGGGASLPGFDISGIEDQISALEIYLAGALLALGAILAFSGINIPLGITLMAIGAATLAAALAQDWDAMPSQVRQALTIVMGIIGAALLAIGVFLCVTGAHIPLGLGLIIAGVASLATAVGLNQGHMESMTQKTLSKIMAIAGAAVLALGIILIVAGQIPMGIALLVLGATALVAAAAINWNTIENNVHRVVNAIQIAVGVAFLALGAILTFSGANIPLGIGLLIAGGVALATAATIDWDMIPRKIRGIWTSITNWFSSNVSPKLTAGYWQGKMEGIKEGISNAFKSAANTVINILNSLIDKINSIGLTIEPFTFMGETIWGGTSFNLFNVPHIPGLATGAVIPANAPFLAMLGDQKSGTNIEAPLDTIVDAFRQVLNERGGHNQEAVMVVDKTVFAKLVYDLNYEEGRRIGVDLVKS